MAILQLYPDSLEDYPRECAPLKDLGFQIIPYLGVNWSSGTDFNSLADIWVIISLITFFVVMTFLLQYPQLILRRWFWIMSLIFVMRALLVVSTRYPRLPYKAIDYHPSSWWAGALLIISGVRATATDMMFSGHTANWIISASFMSRYSHYGLFSILFWIFNILGILSLIAVREHYTADILVAVFLAKFTFWAYHLFFDSLYMRYWIDGVNLSWRHLDKKHDSYHYSSRFRFYPPGRLTDQKGPPEGYSVKSDNTGDLFVTKMHVPSYVNPRISLYRILTFLDGE